ncbi:MAG: response regulator transcription factor [Verrucomicrobia bacterium]|nr:response regulator transcription factor [Verrucomicrobiota bacterium]
MPITFAIVEDVAATRVQLLAVLKRAPGLRCLRACADGEEAVRLLPADAPDVVLMDLNLPGMSGIECVARLKERLPRLQVLIFTTYEDGDQIFNSLRAGASGYLLKSTPPGELVEAIEQVHAGGSPMSMGIARKVVSHFQRIQRPTAEFEQLTPREREILAQLAKGFLYKEIGEQLGISLSTVRAHLHAIYGKLHVQSRTEAVVRYLGRK